MVEDNMKIKRGEVTVTSSLIGLLIGIGVLVLAILLYLILKGKISGVPEFLRNLFRFGR